MGAKNLSHDSKEAIIQMKQKGHTDRYVADIFKITQQGVSKIFGHYKNHGTVDYSPRSGRPRKSTESDDRYLARIAKKDMKANASDIRKCANQGLGLDISHSTAQRILRRKDLPAGRPVKKPFISRKNVKERMKFANEHVDWSIGDWSRVLWSDESPFQLFPNNGTRYVRRPPGKRYDPRYQIPTKKYGGGKIQIWGNFFAVK